MKAETLAFSPYILETQIVSKQKENTEVFSIY